MLLDRTKTNYKGKSTKKNWYRRINKERSNNLKN